MTTQAMLTCDTCFCHSFRCLHWVGPSQKTIVGGTLCRIISKSSTKLWWWGRYFNLSRRTSESVPFRKVSKLVHPALPTFDNLRMWSCCRGALESIQNVAVEAIMPIFRAMVEAAEQQLLGIHGQNFGGEERASGVTNASPYMLGLAAHIAHCRSVERILPAAAPMHHQVWCTDMHLTRSDGSPSALKPSCISIAAGWMVGLVGKACRQKAMSVAASAAAALSRHRLTKW